MQCILVQFPGDKLGNVENTAPQRVDPGEGQVRSQTAKLGGESQDNHNVPSVPALDANADGDAKSDDKMIDLNMKPHRIHGQASNNQVR